MTGSHRASIARSLHAAQLAECLAEWIQLRGGEPVDPVPLVALAARIDAHRLRLQADNAALQAAASDGDDATDEQIASNQLAIKACTVVLGEMTECAGHTLAGAGAPRYASAHAV